MPVYTQSGRIIGKSLESHMPHIESTFYKHRLRLTLFENIFYHCDKCELNRKTIEDMQCI